MGSVSSTITLVDQMSGALAGIEASINSMKSTLQSVAGEQTSIDKFNWGTFLSNAEAAGKRMKQIGQEMTLAVTTPLVLLGKKLYGSAVDYESAYVGMTKTVDGTVEQYEHLNEVVLELSETTPSSYEDLMGIAQTGGNLGVTIDNMETFLRSYSALQAATDQHVAGEAGAQLVADFLNITDGGVQNIEQFGSALVDLGNHFNATEDQILGMAKRMAAAGTLAGLSTPEILGMAAAFRSVGINEEAGGSAASKFIKQMQLASEVGGQAQAKLDAVGQHFATSLDFMNWIDSSKKGDIAALADQLGMTSEAVKSMADSWVLMDQFAEVSGKTSEQFVKDWSKNPAQAMSDFFTGLSQLGEKGGESILATLDKMGLTEIRESNLIAAMASHPELFANAIQTAIAAYTGNTAMWEEFAKQTGTQAAQNQMLGNKLENTMANFGDNVVKAVQPALDKVNELLTAFNGLSETDQDKIIGAFAAFAIGGPIVTAIGATVEAIGKIGKGIGKVKTALTGFLGNGGLTAILSNPVTWGIVAGAGILLLVDYLDSLPSKFEELAKGAQNIPITVDEGTVSETLSKIAEVKAALDGLKAGEIKPEYENTSIATKLGYGTSEMFATSIAYEAAKANASINEVASEYAEKINKVQQEMIDAATSGDTALADSKRNEMAGLQAELDGQLASMKSDYTHQLSALFDGMASQYPEAASALTEAASDYDIMRQIYEAENFDWNKYGGMYSKEAESAYGQLAKSIYKGAWDAGYFSDIYGDIYSNFDSFYADVEQGVYNIPYEDIQNMVMENMNQNLQTLSDNPILSSLLASMLSDPSITENLDVTQLQGTLEGIFKLLDFKQAMDAAGDSPETWGANVSEGLGSGISASAGVPVGAGAAMGTSTINVIKGALGVASPSVYMIEAGQNVDEGLASGINGSAGVPIGAGAAMAASVIATIEGLLNMGTAAAIGLVFGLGMGVGIAASSGVVVAASSSVSNSAVSAAKAILSSGAGSAIGRAFTAGLAGGIRAGGGAVVAAAASVAAAAKAAIASLLSIHSPSKVTYWQGEMTALGFANGISDGKTNVINTVRSIFDDVKQTWDEGTWDLIGHFAGVEAKAWDDEMNDVEDKVKINDSDIQKIRNLAEREVINQFTTAEVKVEMNNTNNISDNMDIDGVIAALEERVTERLEAVAEGVYD